MDLTPALDNPLFGAFSSMMSQFFQDAVASGNLSAVGGGNTNAAPQAPVPAAVPAPLPILAVPAAVPYTSTRSVALPAASTGHPLPSTIPTTFIATQPMLGVTGLGIPMAGHSNNPRRAIIQDVTAEQVSQANIVRRAAAAAHREHGPAGAALQVRQRRTRGAAIRGPSLHAGPQSTLEKVSGLNPAGVREIKVTHTVQAFQVCPLDFPSHPFTYWF